MKREYKRISMALVGVGLTGISVGMFKTAGLGNDPFSALNLGILTVTGMRYSLIYIITNAVLLSGIFLLNRHFIGISTVLNCLFVGIFAEKTMDCLSKKLPDSTLQIRFLLLVGAVILMCFSASFYFTADFGVSTYDAWALILEEKGFASFKNCRICTDICCVIVAAIMGIYPGIGTVITALGMGPLIEFFNKKIAEPLLDGRKTERM